MIDAAGAVSRTIALPAECRHPSGVAVDRRGDVYVVDSVGRQAYAARVGEDAFAPIGNIASGAFFAGWCLVHDWRRNRVVHPVFLIGGLVVIASWPLRMVIARSEWYQPIGDWVARVGAGI